MGKEDPICEIDYEEYDGGLTLKRTARIWFFYGRTDQLRVCHPKHLAGG